MSPGLQCVKCHSTYDMSNVTQAYDTSQSYSRLFLLKLTASHVGYKE